MSKADLQHKINDYQQKKRAVWLLIEATSNDQKSKDSDVGKLDLQVTESFDAVMSHRPLNCHETKLLVEFLLAEIREAVDDSSYIDPLLDLLALKATENGPFNSPA
jgi:hypothetical protein